MGMGLDRRDPVLHVYSQKSAPHAFCMVNVSSEMIRENFLGKDSEYKVSSNIRAYRVIFTSKHISVYVYVCILGYFYIYLYICIPGYFYK